LYALGLALLWFASPFSPPPARAGEQVRVSVFWWTGCGHCRAEKKFLDKLSQESPQVLVRLIDVEEDEGGRLFEAVTKRFGLDKVTPITVIGRSVLVGFDDEVTTGKEIRALVEAEAQAGTGGVTLEAVLGRAPPPEPGASLAPPQAGGRTLLIRLPLVGPVDISRFALTSLTLALGLADGFNPCAMWVLTAFLAALAQLGSRKKMVQFAGLLILSQGMLYALILNSWLLAFDFIGAERIVTPLVGLLALCGGAFFLWDFTRSEIACRITGAERKARTMARLGALSGLDLSLAVVLSILGMAISVSVVEFACSVGIPQAFAKVLEINAVGPLTRQFLIGLYVLAYMFDDLVVFGLAIWGIGRMARSALYARVSNLLGGLLLLALGFLLVFAPERLRF